MKKVPQIFSRKLLVIYVGKSFTPFGNFRSGKAKKKKETKCLLSIYVDMVIFYSAVFLRPTENKSYCTKAGIINLIACRINCQRQLLLAPFISNRHH